MSPGSYKHLVEGTKLADASYGKAFELKRGQVHFLTRLKLET